MNFRYKKFFVVLLATSLLGLICADAKAAPDKWQNVAISGANCWVTGIIAQPLKPGLYYARTDVGGAYRWDGARSAWIAITDQFNFDQRTYYGMESIAVDPQNVNTVYIAAGMYTDRIPAGFIFKSTNQGRTWTKLSGLNGGAGLPMGSNLDRRWGGERLMVDPGNSDIILFGSRQSGLWRSADGGGTWHKIGSIPSPQPGKAGQYGVSVTAFDPKSPSTVYAAVDADKNSTANPGVYLSTDSGATFTLLSGAYSDVRRMLVGTDHSLWLAYGGGVVKYAKGQWKSVTPPTAGIYVGLAVDPTNPNRAAVSAGEATVSDLYVTENGGGTWSKLSYKLSTPVTWYHAGTTYGVSTLLFDTQNRSALWYVDGVGIWKTDNYKASPVQFDQQAAGQEETCPNGLACPPSGPELLVTEMDVDGFEFNADSLSTYPVKQLGMYIDSKKSWNGWSNDIAFDQSDPKNMVRSGAQGWFSGYNLSISNDGGKIWNESTALVSDGRKPMRVAMSTGDPDNIVALCSGAFVYTVDGGQSWYECQGLPNAPTGQPIFYAPLPLCADTVRAGTFYYYDGKSAALYRSASQGATWSMVSSGEVLPKLPTYELRCQPGAAGDLWLAEEQDTASWQNGYPPPSTDGLYHSSDGGVTWSKLSKVTRSFTFSFGKAGTNGLNSLFIYGRLSGDRTDKIYWSTDLGNTWKNIQDPAKPIGNQPWYIEGSQQTYGRLFIATGGRGVYWGDPSPKR
jgi:hypothetical protein